MPKLTISSAYEFDSDLIKRLMEEVSIAIAKMYVCHNEHVWVSWQHEIGKQWYFKGRHYLENELIYIEFEFSCFRDSSQSSINELLELINKRISIALPKAHIFGKYIELKPNETILNEKVLIGGV